MVTVPACQWVTAPGSRCHCRAAGRLRVSHSASLSEAGPAAPCQPPASECQSVTVTQAGTVTVSLSVARAPRRPGPGPGRARGPCPGRHHVAAGARPGDSPSLASESPGPSAARSLGPDRLRSPRAGPNLVP